MFIVGGGAKINNKVLVLVYVPILEQEYSIFIPICKTVGTVKTVIMNIISELVEQKFINQMQLVNRQSNKVYNDNTIVKYTGIKNGTKMLLV